MNASLLILGAGPAGVAAAKAALESGACVTLVDAGLPHPPTYPPTDFLTARTTDADQHRWMVGENFEALRAVEAVSPKMRVPAYAPLFAGFHTANRLASVGSTVTLGALAAGGLSNLWGCGVARWSHAELAHFPVEPAIMDAAYDRVATTMGISGRSEDAMAAYFGLDAFAQPPIAPDRIHERLLRRYAAKRDRLLAQEFRAGQPRVAALSAPMGERDACNRSSNCLWGCARGSLYNASQTLQTLKSHPNFTYHDGMVAEAITREHEGWTIEARDRRDGTPTRFTAPRLLLAAGTLATTRLVLAHLGHRAPVPVLSSPTAAFMLWLPEMLGARRENSFGLGQFSYALKLAEGVSAFGSTFALTGIPMSELASRLPLRRPLALSVLRALTSSCIVGNLFLPGQYGKLSAQLTENGTLQISGDPTPQTRPLMDSAARRLRRSFLRLGAVMLPGSFTLGTPGSDVHYSGSLPMRADPAIGETSPLGEVAGAPGLYVVDGASLPYLSEKSHTLTIMANADRIARAVTDTL